MWCAVCGEDSDFPVCENCLDTKGKNTLLIMLGAAEGIEPAIKENNNGSLDY